MKLAGVSVIVTRAAADGRQLSAMLQDEGAIVRELPALRIQPHASGLQEGLAALPSSQWAVFTSGHGVQVVRDQGPSLRWPASVRIAAVGSGTRQAILDAGWPPPFVPSPFTTEALARQMPEVEGRTVLLLRARQGNPALAEVLTKRGATVRDVAVYDTVAEPGLLDQIGAIATGAADWITFASPSAVQAVDDVLVASCLTHLRRTWRAACIGPVTAEAARRRGYSVAAQAHPHTMEGLAKAILETHLHA